jgi:hypothetical protein
MAHSKILGCRVTREWAMPIGIVPESFLGLLAAFAHCFGAPTYRNFELLIVGWVHCLGHLTITAVALASGSSHISVSPLFSRAAWAVENLGRVVFGLAAAIEPQWCFPPNVWSVSVPTVEICLLLYCRERRQQQGRFHGE